MMQTISDEDKELAAGYVLGDLSPDEQQIFEQRLQQNTALQAEVQAFQAAFRVLPQALSIVPPPSQLGERIVAAAASAPSRRAIPWSKIIAGAAILAALWLGADNLRLRQSIAKQTEVDRLAAILQRPTSRLVALKGNGNSAAGTLLFTPGQWQDVVVSLGNLPPLPADQVYRMWLTLNNGSTLPCGEFNPNATGSVFVKLSPPEQPPKGSKATGIFVTVDRTSAPLAPQGSRIISGAI